jgi:hypothetical protein
MVAAPHMLMKAAVEEDWRRGRPQLSEYSAALSARWRRGRGSGCAALLSCRIERAYIMKHGPTPNHWNEYIFCAYTGHQHEAVFLTGIPDIKESLPHA